MNEVCKFDELTDEQMRAVDSVCIAFERDLHSDKAAPIEQILESVSDDLKMPVFLEILAIEMEWLRSRSTDINIAKYLSRFPKHHAEIHELAEACRLDSPAAKVTEVGTHGSPRKSRAMEIPTAGTVIDNRYTILESIGEGGMGIVFLAKQHSPVSRQVAIKFIKYGVDSKAVLARFDIERRALAMMDHPGIAQVHDGGRSANGLPYFVMELVRGDTITDYCDKNCLDVPNRLNLFVSICNAVQHAHLKGIIHRDLKPGNLLVSEIDGKPFIKVIDFGVAKAVDQNLTEKNAEATGLIVGTPAYMSPEQTDPTSIDIDMRSDVYSLGVVLFELLVGMPPHDVSNEMGGSILDFLNKVRDVDSPRPSSKVNSTAKLTKIAAERDIEPERLARLLRGELDWIVLKALEKDRSRRYETVNSFSRDIQRYLEDDVVEARPPSNSYRLRKLVTRNKGLVLAVGLLFMMFVAGITGTGSAMYKAQIHARAAQLEVVEKEAALKKEARQRKYAEAIAEFVESDFLALTTLEGRLENGIEDSSIDKDSTLRDLLDRASRKLKARNDLDPYIEARLHWIIGGSYHRLGVYQSAISSFERSTELYKNEFGIDNLKTLEAQDNLAKSLQSNGQHGRALPLLQETISRKVSLLGSEHIQTLKSKSLLATNYLISGEPTKAIPIIEDVLAATTSIHGPKHRRTLVRMYELAIALNRADQSEKAMSLLQKTLQIQTETLNENHPDLQACREKLGELYYKSGLLTKARPLLEQGLEWSISVYGDESRHTVYSMSQLTGLYRNLRQLDLALPLAKQTLELTKKVFGLGHPNVANAMSDLAMTLRAAGEHDDALPLFKSCLAAKKENLGERHPGTLIAMGNVAACLRSTRQLPQSLEMNSDCLILAKEILGDQHSHTISIKQNLAAGYWSAKNLDRSVPLFEEVLVYWESRNGRSHPKTLIAIANIGINYRDAGRLNEAVALLEEVYLSVPTNPSLGFVDAELLDAYLRAGKNDKGLTLLHTLDANAREKYPADSLKLASRLALLGKILLRSDVLKESERLFRESIAIRRPLEPESWSNFNTISMLGESLLKQELYLDASELLTTAANGMKRHSATIPDKQVGRLVIVLKHLVEAAIALKKPDDVAKWESELAILRAKRVPK